MFAFTLEEKNGVPIVKPIIDDTNKRFGYTGKDHKVIVSLRDETLTLTVKNLATNIVYHNDFERAYHHDYMVRSVFDLIRSAFEAKPFTILAFIPDFTVVGDTLMLEIKQDPYIKQNLTVPPLKYGLPETNNPDIVNDEFFK